MAYVYDAAMTERTLGATVSSSPRVSSDHSGDANPCSPDATSAFADLSELVGKTVRA